MKKIILFIILSYSLCTISQTSTRAIADQSHSWTMFNGSIKIKPKWSVFYDIQFRRADFYANWQQQLYRTAIIYQLHENVGIGAGYGYVATFPYGDFPVKMAFPEHRTFLQLHIQNTIGVFRLFHRYRAEQRWIGNSTDGTFDNPRYENRFRYMLKTTFSIIKIKEKQLYGALYNEFFVNLGENVGRNIFDQNRAYAAVGVAVTKNINLEIGSLNQTLQQRGLIPVLNQNIFEVNHTLAITTTINLDVTKKED